MGTRSMSASVLDDGNGKDLVHTNVREIRDPVDAGEHEPPEDHSDQWTLGLMVSQRRPEEI